jgi:hypothetical protein
VVKFQSYLAGSAFALLLAAHIAMQLLHAYPANQYLWHLNIIFAREARPLLQHLDVLTGGNSPLTILTLGTLALLCIASARTNMRLLAAANCHIALILFIFLAARSFVRTYPHGLPVHDKLASLGTELSVVQFGMLAFMVVLSAVCVEAHVRILGRGFASMRWQRADAAMQKASSHTPLRARAPVMFGLPGSEAK